MGPVVFIYSKQGKIKALGSLEAEILHKNLILDDWIQTHTLDVCRTLEYLHNECKEDSLKEEIRSLSAI